MDTQTKTVKKKTLPHQGKKLPFGIFSFRVCVPKNKKEDLVSAIGAMHHHIRDAFRAMTEDGGLACAEFRCQGAYRKKTIMNHFAETLHDFSVQHSKDGIHFGADANA